MVINPLSFARSASMLSGQLPASLCARLCEGLPRPQAGVFEWRLSGRCDAAHAWLDVQAQGRVRVVCQRCLAPFDLPLVVSGTRGLLDNAAQLAALDALEAEGRGSDTEYLVADAPLDVQQLVEDELILVMPFAPRHEVCPGGQAPVAQEDAGARSPFAVLAQLKKQ